MKPFIRYTAASVDVGSRVAGGGRVMGRHTRAMLYGIGIGIAFILILESLGLAEEPKAAQRAALVNGEAISLAEVDDVIKQRATPLTAPTAKQIRMTRLEVVTAMVDDLLIRQYLRDHGPKIDQAEIDKQFAVVDMTLSSQKKTLAQYLRELRQTETQFKANLTMLLQLDKYMKAHTSEEQLKHYYEANKDYFDKITVRTSHIVIRVAADAPASERQAARKKLQALRAEIAAGKIDFAKAAKENSQCPSAPKGGDIGYIFRKFQNVDEAYARTAFAMKVGEISDVVDSDFGCHLIKLTERTEGKPSKYEACADEVRDSYTEELRLGLLNQLRKKSKVEVALP
jgi:parvulin-like peptidyl-prolyl isomerase